MDLYKEIILKHLSSDTISVKFENLNIKTADIVELECYKILQKIKEIILNDDLEDKECFIKIDETITLFMESGIDSGIRHDFG